MIYRHQFNNLPVCTGDIICTTDGVEGSLHSQLWKAIGRCIPGEVDHCLIYLGPGGRCVESNPKGVIIYEMVGDRWDAVPLTLQRLVMDTFWGVVYPLRDRNLSIAAETQIRLGVAAYCLEQAKLHKPYNLNFANPDCDRAFYCSQLVYKAYLAQGINLNTNVGVPAQGLLGKIVFPEEIWNGFPHVRAVENQAINPRKSQHS